MRKGCGLLGAIRRDASGNVAAIVSIAAFALVGATAVSVDGSMFYIQKRKLQGAADLAALAAAASQDPTAAAKTSLTANGITPTRLAATQIAYAADPATAAGSRVTAASADTTNGIRIDVAISAPMIFGAIFQKAGDPPGTVSIAARASAAGMPLAAFSLGSRTASVDGGIANAVLSSLLGASVSLSAIDYNSLAAGRIDVGGFLAGAARLGGSGGSYADLLNQRIPVGRALSALAGADPANAGAIGEIVRALPTSQPSVRLGDIADLGGDAARSAGSPLGATITANTYDMLANIIASGAGSQPATIDLGAAIPGIATSALSLTLGPSGLTEAEAPPRRTTTLSTRQVKLALTTGATLPGASIQLPVTATIGAATATTQGPTCASGASMDVAVQPAAVQMSIGANGPVPVANVLGLAISASSTASTANAPTTITFRTPDVGNERTATSPANFASLTGSLVGNATLSVVGIGLSQPSAVRNGLSQLAVPTAGLLDRIAAALGIGIGQADVTVTSLSCGKPTLIE